MLIGAQGYTIRDHARNEEEVRASVKKLSEIGFKSLQYSGMAKVDPYWLRDLIDEFDMEISITHAPPERILNETAALIEEHKIFRCGRIGIGALPGQYTGSLEAIRAFIKDYAEATALLAGHGMRLHYHNHSYEYERFDGHVMFDVLVEETSPDRLAFIPDTYWIQDAGRCPASQIEALKGRVEVAHFKDLEIVKGQRRMAVVGEGNLSWEEIISACKKAGATHIMIEQDDCYGQDPFECLARSRQNLNTLLKTG